MELETATDDDLRAAINEAELPALLTALAHVTGDLSLIRDELRPPMPASPGELPLHGGMSLEQQELAKADAFEALRAFRDSGSHLAPEPAAEVLQSLMRFITGDASDEYLPFIAHELDIPSGMGDPAWTKDEIDPSREFVVAIIGAGMSGLAAAYRLTQAGIPFDIYEKNYEVGGTWYENKYPGCRLDTNNFAYSYSFEQKQDWPQQFSARDAILDYFATFATTSGLRNKVQFGTEILAATFREDSLDWSLRLWGPSGNLQEKSYNAVISAVGQLNRPNIPNFTNQDKFTGASWHTSQWNDDVDLTGKRVAVIGTGASAFQVIPSIADTVGELIVFQRNAPWMYPTPNYHDDNAPGLLWLFDVLPTYHRWFRFFQFWTSVEGRRRFAAVDPEWSKPGSVSAENELMRQALTSYFEEQFSDRPDLLERVIPNYPPAAKRMLRDNGVWAKALKQENVHLVSDGIQEFTATGIRTRDGVLHEVDVIIYGTGFTASDFLSPMKVTGMNGVDLHEWWNGDARAYLGITIPGFPNLFCLYGPNTNLVVNGSIILFSELAIDYTLESFRALLTERKDAMDCRVDAFERYNAEIDEANDLTAWGASGVSSWYKNAYGRVSQNWPFPLLEYWTRTRNFDPEAYDFHERERSMAQ